VGGIREWEREEARGIRGQQINQHDKLRVNFLLEAPYTVWGELTNRTHLGKDTRQDIDHAGLAPLL
jgi:hypothetical protein